MTTTLFKKIAITLLCFTVFTTAQAQTTNAPTVQFSRLYGGSGDDHPRTIIQAADKGYVMAGWAPSTDGQVTGSHGNGYNDAWVIKTDSLGNLLWNRAIGGGNGHDDAASLAELQHAFLVAGTRYSSDGDFASHPGPVPQGYIAWLNKATGVPYRIVDYAEDWGGTLSNIQYVSPNRILISCTLFNSSHAASSSVILIDSIGKIIWKKTYGRIDYYHSDNTANTVPTKDGGYMMAGSTTSDVGHTTGLHGTLSDVWLLRLDSAGNKRWSRCYGSTGDESATNIAATADGGFIIGGNTSASTANGDVANASQGNVDYWVFKIDSLGTVKWSKTIGGSNVERLFGMALTCDNGVVLSGHAYSNDGDVAIRRGGYDAFIVRLDSLGNIAWKETYGSTMADFEGVITVTRDGGYALAAVTGLVDGDVAGTIHGSGDYWLAKLSPDGRHTYCPAIVPPVPNSVAGTHKEEGIILYPNPADEQLSISREGLTDEPATIRLLSITGQVVQTLYADKGRKKIVLPTGSLPAGMYYLSIQTKGGAITRKVLIRH